MSFTFYRQLPQINAMTFDLDDTLYDNWPVIEHLEKNTRQWLLRNFPKTQSISESQWDKLKKEIATHTPFLRSDVTEWRLQQIQQGLQLSGYDSSTAIAGAKQAMECVLTWRNEITIPQETHRVLSQLASKMPLVAITNGNADPSRCGLGEYFSLVLSAGSGGWAKPHDEMFQKALDYLKLPPAQVLHVGDDLIADVFGAKKTGLSACWINGWVHNKPQNIAQLPQAKTLPDVAITELSDLCQLV